MPKQVRKKQFTPEEKDLFDTFEPEWRVEENVRFWCPLCGMVANEDRLEHSPYPVKVRMQKYGGSFTIGTRHLGYLRYFEVNTELQEKILGRIKAVASNLLPYLEAEAEPAPLIGLAQWYRLAEGNLPAGVDQYEILLLALTMAASEAIGEDVHLQEVEQIFGSRLRQLPHSLFNFAAVAEAASEALLDMAAKSTSLNIYDEDAVRLKSFDLAVITVPPDVEAIANSFLKKNKINRNTRKYFDWLERNRNRLVTEERQAFEAVRKRQLDAIDRELSKRNQEARRAEIFISLLEKGMDIVTGLYTLAGKRLPQKLIDRINATIETIEIAVKTIADLFQQSREKVKEQTFTGHMDKYEGPILKAAYEAVGPGEEESPDIENHRMLVDKWRTTKVRNSVRALKDLDVLTETDVSAAEDALEEYRVIERSEFDSQEEYMEARDEAWEEFLESLEALDPGDLREE